MVKRLSALGFVAMFAAVALIPSRADGILDQIQTEVAGIVKGTKGAIVTIEDIRGVETSSGKRASAERQEFNKRLAAALKKELDLESQLAGLRSLYTSAHPKMAALTRERDASLAELQKLEAEARKRSDGTQILVEFDQERLDALMSKRMNVENSLTQLAAYYGPSHPKMTEMQGTKSALTKQIATAQQSLDKDRQKQTTDTAHQRPDPPKAGTGFSIGDGYIVTTFDVLEGMAEPIVITDGGRRIKATIAGMDRETNVGLLKLSAEANIPALKLGDSDTAAPGHFAILIGNQFGLSNSSVLNMVSGIRTEGMYSGHHFYSTVLQIAGTIGAGNSGAPILNAHGEVIGVVVAVPMGDWTSPPPPMPGTTSPSSPPTVGATPGGGASSPSKGPGVGGSKSPGPAPLVGPSPRGDNRDGPRRDDRAAASVSATANNGYYRPSVSSAGFAVPINDIKSVIDDLEHGKQIQHGWLGVFVRSTANQVEKNGVIQIDRSVYIHGLYPDSPATRAGLQIGDVIVSINGKPINADVQVRIATVKANPGDTLTFVVRRLNGQTLETKTLTLKVDPRPTVFDRSLITKEPK